MKQTQKMKRERSRKEIILNIIMRVLCIILFIQIFVFIGNVLDYQTVYLADEATLIRQVNYQEYDSLVENVYRNAAHGEPLQGDMQKIYAVAYYYEAAMMYNAYQTVGNTGEAQRQYEKMQEYEAQMGEYSFAKDDILKYLNIEK